MVSTLNSAVIDDTSLVAVIVPFVLTKQCDSLSGVLFDDFGLFAGLEGKINAASLIGREHQRQQSVRPYHRNTVEHSATGTASFYLQRLAFERLDNTACVEPILRSQSRSAFGIIAK